MEIKIEEKVKTKFLKAVISKILSKKQERIRKMIDSNLIAKNSFLPLLSNIKIEIYEALRRN